MGGTALRLFLASTLLAGCGSVKDSGTGVDANNEPQDAGPDADETGTATVITEAALFGGTIGAQVPNIDIVSMLPNNTVLEAKTTDASGAATIKVYPGGTVTAIYKHTADMGADLITWVGVKPNDTLTFGSRQFSFPSGTQNMNLGTQAYTWPAQAGVTQYIVATSSNAVGAPAGSTGASMAEFSLNHRDPMDVLFVATTNGTLTHFSSRSNVTFPSATPISAGGWQAAQQATVNINGLPPEITNISGNFTTVLDGHTEQNFIGGYNGQPTGGAFTANFPWHPAGERTMATLFMGRQGFQSMRIIDALQSNALAQTIAAPALPPWMQSSVISSSALRMASWFVIPDANSTSDAQLLRVNYNRTINSMNHPHQWHFILPPGQTSIVFPKLPAQFNDVLPQPQDGMGAQVRQIEIGSITGYDAARALPSRNLMCVECALRAGEFQRAIISGN